MLAEINRFVNWVRRKADPLRFAPGCFAIAQLAGRVAAGVGC